SRDFHPFPPHRIESAIKGGHPVAAEPENRRQIHVHVALISGGGQHPLWKIAKRPQRGTDAVPAHVPYRAASQLLLKTNVVVTNINAVEGLRGGHPAKPNPGV